MLSDAQCSSFQVPNSPMSDPLHVTHTGQWIFDSQNQLIHTVYEGVNELESSEFPSSQRRGGCAVNLMSRSHLFSRRRGGQFGKVFSPEMFRQSDHPVRSIKGGFATSFMSRPPLLCEEGNSCSRSNSFTASMTARLSLVYGKSRGNRPRLQFAQPSLSAFLSKAPARAPKSPK